MPLMINFRSGTGVYLSNWYVDNQTTSINFVSYLGVKLGSTLGTRMDDAMYHSRYQRQLHEEFTTTFRPEQIKRWSAEVFAWYADVNSPDPFEEPEPGESEIRYEKK